MKIRIKFRKWGCMKFIGHLDMMRFFQKVMRRADVDIRYSEGFSPHQIMSFAAPLGVGITSDGEYLDIEVHSTKSSEEMILPSGVNTHNHAPLGILVKMLWASFSSPAAICAGEGSSGKRTSGNSIS